MPGRSPSSPTATAPSGDLPTSRRDLPPGELPADIAMLPVDDLLDPDEMSLGDATSVPYLIATERGTLPETPASSTAITMLVTLRVLDPTSARRPSTAYWNGRLAVHLQRRVRHRPQPGRHQHR